MKFRLMHKIAAAFTAVLALAAAPALGADLTLTFNSPVAVNAEEVLLGDVAVIDGPQCALKEDLKALYLTRAPQPGRTSKVRSAYIEHRLRAGNLPLEQIEYDLPDHVVIERPSQTVPERWVRLAVTDYLGRTEPYKSAKWRLVDLDLGALPDLPLGKITYSIAPATKHRPTSVRLHIYLYVNDREEGRIRADCDIDLAGRAIVAARRLERGHIIQPGDLKEAQVNVKDIPNGALTELEGAPGMAVRRRLDAGRVVLARDLEETPVVQRGDTVTIVAERGPIRVTAPGKVKRDGLLGETVPVLNLSSKKMIVATVVNPNTVRVNF